MHFMGCYVNLLLLSTLNLKPFVKISMILCSYE